jgi:hypothetical protein
MLRHMAFGLISFASLALACNAKPPVGSERGDCYANDTCNQGLSCVSHVCLTPGTPPSAAAPQPSALPVAPREPAPAPVAKEPPPAAKEPPPPAPKEPPPITAQGPSLVEEMDRLADEACSCRDRDCVARVEEQLNRDGDPLRRARSADERHRIEPVVDRFTKCAAAFRGSADFARDAERFTDDACACRDHDCVAAVRDRMREARFSERVRTDEDSRRMSATVDRINKCDEALGPIPDFSRDIERFMNETCACADRDCVDAVQRRLSDWSDRHSLKAEEMRRIDPFLDHMKKCAADRSQ